MHYEKEELTDIDACWVAAMIDCEGMITIHTPWNKIRKNRNIQYYCRVHMTDYEPILKLEQICGGSIKKLNARQENYRDSWYWNITANGLRWLLPQLLPYLIVKKRHAEIALEVLSKNSRGPGKQMSFEQLRPLLLEMRSLQKGGYRGDIEKIRQTFREAHYPHKIHKRDPITRRFVCE